MGVHVLLLVSLASKCKSRVGHVLLVLDCCWTSTTMMAYGSCSVRLLWFAVRSYRNFALVLDVCSCSYMFLQYCSVSDLGGSAINYVIALQLEVQLGWGCFFVFFENRAYIFLAFALLIYSLNLVASAVSLCLAVSRYLINQTGNRLRRTNSALEL